MALFQLGQTVKMLVLTFRHTLKRLVWLKLIRTSPLWRLLLWDVKLHHSVDYPSYSVVAVSSLLWYWMKASEVMVFGALHQHSNGMWCRSCGFCYWPISHKIWEFSICMSYLFGIWKQFSVPLCSQIIFFLWTVLLIFTCTFSVSILFSIIYSICIMLKERGKSGTAFSMTCLCEAAFSKFIQYK